MCKFKSLALALGSGKDVTLEDAGIKAQVWDTLFLSWSWPNALLLITISKSPYLFWPLILQGDHLSQLLNSQNHDFLNIVLLPTTDISGLVDPDASIVTKLVVMMHQSLPALRSTISAMKFRPMALIVDLFGTEAMKVADEFGMLKYVFIASNAWFLAVTIYAPAVDKKELAVHVNQQQLLKIPGCKPVEFQDTLEAFLDPNDPMYDGFLHAGMEISSADGIIVNTWEGTGAAPQALESKVLDWLDMQPTESGDLRVVMDSDGSQDYLPDGFLTRTHNIGLVVPMWAPQAEILQHPSVEQKMNATMLTEELGVALRSKELPSESMVERQEIEMMVDKEGHAIKK
ncbi:hypothetical protein Patl1_28879 [Pistacia atlantica]|uniref:Uncharacterized protein n=1 Tax=Pistacia atlantica TaxID=434234 RepID=A0ACC1BGX9_9ROSI|nr:hypothetical protein Patl1_28879 [Pistacia atlantica]